MFLEVFFEFKNFETKRQMRKGLEGIYFRIELSEECITSFGGLGLSRE